MLLNPTVMGGLMNPIPTKIPISTPSFDPINQNIPETYPSPF